MNTPHKHAALIKAWADGATIEYFSEPRNKWIVVDDPSWDKHYQYRIKPVPVVVIKYGCVGEAVGYAFTDFRGRVDNIKLTFIDGTLVSAEVLKEVK